MNGELYTQLRLLARDVPIGATGTGLVCPRCLGGRERESSLSITRMEASRIAYYCHRASCGFNGYLGRSFGDFNLTESTSLRTEGSSTVRFQGRPFLGDVRHLGEEWLSELEQLYAISNQDAAHFGWLEETSGRRLVVPVRGPLGQARGVQTRASKQSPVGIDYSRCKTRDYPESDEPWMGWWYPMVSGGNSGIVPVSVLVEDVLSSAKVSLAGYVSCSLMGSHLSLDQLTEASEYSKSLILALDRDATSKALRLAARYGFLSSGIKVLILDRDLKYEPITRIKEMVQSVVDESL